MTAPLSEFRLSHYKAVYNCEIHPSDRNWVRLLIYRDTYLDFTDRFPSEQHACEFAVSYHARRVDVKRQLVEA